MKNLNIENHEDLIQKIIFKQFGQKADKIERMMTGLDNEVYSAQVGGSDYIVRLNERDSLKGSSKYIPLFKSKGIKVPDIIAEDYSKEVITYNWQILNKIEGVDIDRVISDLTDDQLKNIAREISNIVKKLILIPTNSSFGYIGISESKLKDSWIKVLKEMLITIKKRTEKTAVVKREYIEVFQMVLDNFADYFSKVTSQFYFDDMSSKNVIINDGKFNGLVDLDGVSYGDYLEGIGRIKTSWYGTRYGEIYTQAIMDNLDLTEEQRKWLPYMLY